MRSIAWNLAQLLQLTVEEAFPMDEVMPWMGKRLVTAGGVAQWLQQEFTGLAFWRGYDRKCRKFTFPEARKDARLHVGTG